MVSLTRDQGNTGRPLEDAALNFLEEMRMCQVKKTQPYTMDSNYASCKETLTVTSKKYLMLNVARGPLAN